MKKTFSTFSESIIHSDGSVTTYTREHIIIETLEGLKYLPRKKNFVDNTNQLYYN